MDYNFIGIDLGSKTSIQCHLKGQASNIILNEIGGRQTPVCISYSENERLFGEQAVVSTRSRPLSTIVSPQRFFTQDQKQIQIEIPYSLAKFDKNHFHLEGPNFDLNVTPQQVLTGYLNYIQSLTKDIPQTTPFFYTMSVPNHCGYKTRKQLSKCISAVVPSTPSIVSQKMAVGLDYLINTSKQKQSVLFIDFGHSKLTAYALKFTDESIVELVEGSYSNLGVRCIDAEIVKHLQGMIKFKLNQKSKLKLKDIATKTRTILSANSEHTIAEDFGDNDFQYKVTRQMFEKICEVPFGYVKNFLELIKKTLIQRKIQINKIQVFGGGSRIPYFQQMLSSIFNLQARKAINNEAISRGCALYTHHRQKISKLGKIQLKQILKCKIKLFINHYQKQAVGPVFDSKKAENIESHLLYEIGTFNDDKKLSIEPRKNHSIQLWFITEQQQPLVEYYNINYDQIDKEITNIHFDISMVDGYPKIRSINGQTKNPGLTRPVPFVYDTKPEIDALRAFQLQFRAVDIRVLDIQEKRNKIQSQVFRVKNKYPEAQKYLDTLRTMSVVNLDNAIKQLTSLQC